MDRQRCRLPVLFPLLGFLSPRRLDSTIRRCPRLPPFTTSYSRGRGTLNPPCPRWGVRLLAHPLFQAVPRILVTGGVVASSSGGAKTGHVPGGIVWLEEVIILLVCGARSRA